MKSEAQFKHLMVTILAVVIMGFFAMVTLVAKPLDPIKRAIENFSFTDVYYEILKDTGTPDTSRLITIVDLTKLTNRTDIGQTIYDIESFNPKVLGVDCCFDNYGEDIEGNALIVEVAEKYKNIVWSQKMLDYSGVDSIGWTRTIHSFFAEFTDITEGTTNMPRALYDSMKRTMPIRERYQGKYCPSFVSQVVNKYAGKDITKGIKGDIKINFSPIRFRVLSPQEVCNHPEMIENQIVLFGSMYEDVDMHWTPVGKIAGVVLLAYSVQTLVYGTVISEIPTWLFGIISFLIVFLTQMWQSEYIDRTNKSNNLFVKHILGSTYIINILITVVTLILVGISFFVFKLYNVSFNMAWALSAIALLSTSRNMYSAIKDYLAALSDKYKFIKRFKHE